MTTMVLVVGSTRPVRLPMIFPWFYAEQSDPWITHCTKFRHWCINWIIFPLFDWKLVATTLAGADTMPGRSAIGQGVF
jgi:hypothetical protein